MDGGRRRKKNDERAKEEVEGIEEIEGRKARKLNLNPAYKRTDRRKTDIARLFMNISSARLCVTTKHT